MTNFHLDTILILVQQLVQHDDTREARKHVGLFTILKKA